MGASVCRAVARTRGGRVTVIGVGAIGRPVALQLAAMGAGHLDLIDHDVVEPVNLGPQAYLESDIGIHKVEATAGLCGRLCHETVVHPVAERFHRGMAIGDTVFCCVDSITTRRHIWNCLGDQVACFIDGRMAAEALRVITAADPDSRERYPNTLFDESEAYAGACTARSTIYSAAVAAGLMVGQWTKWLRGMPVDADLSLNLLAGELTVC